MRRASVKFALAASTAMVWIAPAMAQEAPASNDIIVTARRIEERLQDVPISITVVTPQTISNRNITSASDLATYTPSLSSSSRYGPEQATFNIRGFYQEQGTAPSVGVYFGDVVVPRASGTIVTAQGGGPGLLFDLQNIQVLRGPQGTLQGRNTTGGAILLVPQKPTDKFEGYVEGSYGNFDMKRVQAVVNVPINDTFRIRAGIDRMKRDGYLDNQSGIGPDRLANTDYIAARVSVVADLTPDLENYTIISYSRSHNNGSVAKALACDASLNFLAALGCGQLARAQARGDGFWDVDNADPTSHYRATQWQIINTTTWSASDNLTVKNIASYGEVRAVTDSSLFGDNLQIPIAPGVSIPVTGIVFHPGIYGDNTAESTFVDEFRLQGTALAGRLNWQAGAYFEFSDPLGTNSQLTQIFAPCTDIYKFQCNAGPLGIGTLTDTSTADTFNDKGFYGQATYKLTDKLSLTGGFRYTIDHQTEVAENAQVNFPAPNTPLLQCQDLVKYNGPHYVSSPMECQEVFHQHSAKPTWLVDLDYKVTNDIMAYAKYSRGYRAGGINSTNVNSNNTTWDPEKVDTYELGLKTSFRGAVHGSLNIAGFYNNFSNQQLSGLVYPTAYGQSIGLAQNQVILNAGKSRIWGLEVEGSLSPFRGFRVDVGYAYLNTKLKSIQNFPGSIYYSPPQSQSLSAQDCASNPQLKGVAACSDLEFAPRNRVSVTASYTLPLDKDVGAITFGANYTHSDANNSTSVLISPTLYRNTPENLVNLNASWTSILKSPIDASVFVTNLTNAKDYIGNTGGISTGVDAVILAPPRMYGLRLRYNFGR
jgi:iron complex outermembrane receptor protein